jgi:hypothetical protein
MIIAGYLTPAPTNVYGRTIPSLNGVVARSVASSFQGGNPTLPLLSEFWVWLEADLPAAGNVNTNALSISSGGAPGKEGYFFHMEFRNVAQTLPSSTGSNLVTAGTSSGQSVSVPARGAHVAWVLTDVDSLLPTMQNATKGATQVTSAGPGGGATSMCDCMVPNWSSAAAIMTPNFAATSRNWIQSGAIIESASPRFAVARAAVAKAATASGMKLVDAGVVPRLIATST